MNLHQIQRPIDHKRPQRQIALYMLWLLERNGKAPENIGRVEIFDWCDPPMVRIDGEDYSVPGPSMREWKKRLRLAMPSGQSKQTGKPKSHRYYGITVVERWPWSEHRAWEERDTIRKLLLPMPSDTSYVRGV